MPGFFSYLRSEKTRIHQIAKRMAVALMIKNSIYRPILNIPASKKPDCPNRFLKESLTLAPSRAKTTETAGQLLDARF